MSVILFIEWTIAVTGRLESQTLQKMTEVCRWLTYVLVQTVQPPTQLSVGCFYKAES